MAVRSDSVGGVGISFLKFLCALTTHLWPLAGTAHLFDISGQLTASRCSGRAVVLRVWEVCLRWCETTISHSSLRVLIKGGTKQRHTILDRKCTHWITLRLGGGLGPAGASALRLAGQGWSTRGVNAAAAVTLPASDAEQRTEVGNVSADRWPGV